MTYSHYYPDSSAHFFAHRIRSPAARQASLHCGAFSASAEPLGFETAEVHRCIRYARRSLHVLRTLDRKDGCTAASRSVAAHCPTQYRLSRLREAFRWRLSSRRLSARCSSRQAVIVMLIVNGNMKKAIVKQQGLLYQRFGFFTHVKFWEPVVKSEPTIRYIFPDDRERLKKKVNHCKFPTNSSGCILND